jgi:hypothetical protein
MYSYGEWPNYIGIKVSGDSIYPQDIYSPVGRLYLTHLISLSVCSPLLADVANLVDGNYNGRVPRGVTF